MSLNIEALLKNIYIFLIKECQEKSGLATSKKYFPGKLGIFKDLNIKRHKQNGTNSEKYFSKIELSCFPKLDTRAA
jgi:hypothetical protein